MAAKTSVRTRRDRYADLIVIAIVVIALLLGWAVMALAEGQSETFADAGSGLTIKYPQGWILKADDKLAFQALDPGSAEFKTTVQVRIWPVGVVEAVTPTLSSILNGASLVRAQEGTAYRMFDISQGPDLGDRATMEATYVYVADSVDLFAQHMPVVVQGLDIAVIEGDQAYVFSLLADKDQYAKAEKAFRRLVKDVEIR